MKIVQTFWSGPRAANKGNLLQNRAGWLSCEYHWMSWALSCLQAKNVFGAVHLVTDDRGKDILVDKLQLPYESVSTELQGTLDQYPASLWALAKIYTYSIQTSPFLHIDGDVFIWRQPPPDLLKAQLISQNLDKNLPFYAEILKLIKAHLPFVPDGFLPENFENTDVYASNAGLLGGSNLSFFEEYCRLAFEFIDKNSSHLTHIKGGGLNFIFEQYLFCRLAAERGIPISYYKGVVDNPVFKDFIRFEDFPNVDMVHPVGGFKQYPHVGDHLAKKLRKDYPEYYYRIINLLRGHGVEMRSAIYLLNGFNAGCVVQNDALPTISRRPFIRTKAAITHLNKTQFMGDEIDIDGTLDSKRINEITLKLKNPADINRLFEIYRLEVKRDNLLKKTYKDALALNNLYARDLEAYQQIQHLFTLPKEQILQTVVSTPKGYMQMRQGWDWKFDYLKDIPTIVERNFNQKKLSQTVILIPDVLQADIKEYYPDDLDQIIFETLKTPFSITSLLTEMKQYFTQEEINEDYPSFESLIINTVKRLLYYGLLKINLH